MGRAPGNGGNKQRVAAKARKNLDSVQTKQDLLAQLTRQAELNTKILERERAQLLAMEIQSVETQHVPLQGMADLGPNQQDGVNTWETLQAGGPSRGPMYAREPSQAVQGRRGADRQRQGAGDPVPHNAQPARERRGGPMRVHISRNHQYLDAPVRLFDRNQVPGLAAGGDSEPQSPFKGHDNAPAPSGPGQTFPDSPGFYEGMVIAIPMSSSPKNGAGAPQGQGSTVTPPHSARGVGGAANRRVQMQGKQQQQQQQRMAPQQAQDALPRRASKHQMPEPSGQLLGMVQQQQQQQEEAHLLGGALLSLAGQGEGAWSPAQARAAQGARKEAYRRDLEEQIAARQAQKKAEKEADRRQGEMQQQRLAQQQQQWEALSGAKGRVANGEQSIAPGDHSMADPRYGNQLGPGPVHPGPLHPPPDHAWGPDGRSVPLAGRRSQPPLTVQVPGLPGRLGGVQPLGPIPAPPPGMVLQGGGAAVQFGETFSQGMGAGVAAMPQGPIGTWVQPSWQGQQGVGPSPPQGHVPPPHHHSEGRGSPSGQPHSPGGGQRKFMGAMAELRPGPSEEQRRFKEAQRLQLQMDLQEQIRQKKERQELQRQKEEAQRIKEERELQAYYDRMKAQKDEEARAAREQAREVEAAAAAAAHQVVPARADAGGKPRRVAKQLIDADWLDKPQQGGLPGAGLRQPGVQQGPGALAAEASQGSVGAGPTVYGQQHQPRVTHESSASELHPGLRRLGGPQPHAWSPPQQQADTKQPYAPGQDSSPPGHGSVGHLLSQLQQEQARLKEEFSRQAGLMEQVSKDASSAVSERDRAWQEVERLRIALGGGDVRAPELRGERLRHSLSADTLDSFVVSTHLLPRDANTIPTRLPTPLEAPWAAQREPLLVQKEGMGAGHGLDGAAEMQDVLNSLDQLLRARDQGMGAASHIWGRDTPVGHRSRSAGAPYTSSSSQEYLGPPGLYRPLSRVHGPPSQIPQAPYLGPGYPGGGQFQSKYRRAYDHPGLDGMDVLPYPQYAAPAAGGHGAPQQVGAQQQQPPPAVAFGRRAHRAAGRPPPSPAILRGDHLPSPTRKVRGELSGAPPAAAAPPPPGRRRAAPANGRRGVDAVVTVNGKEEASAVPPLAPARSGGRMAVPTAAHPDEMAAVREASPHADLEASPPMPGLPAGRPLDSKALPEDMPALGPAEVPGTLSAAGSTAVKRTSRHSGSVAGHGVAAGLSAASGQGEENTMAIDVGLVPRIMSTLSKTSTRD